MKNTLLSLSLCALLAMAAWAAAQNPPQAGASSSTGVAAEAAQGQTGASASTTQQNGAQTAPSDPAKGSAKGGTAASGGAQAGVSANTPGAAGAEIASGTTINAELTKSLDAKKVREGQEVQARVTQDVRSGGRVIVPRGAKLIGHVTQASARGKGEANGESQLGIAFDHAVLKNGEPVPVHAVIQALAAPPTLASSYGDMSDVDAGSESGMGSSAAGRGDMSPAGRGAIGAVGQTAGGIAGNAGAQTAGTVGGIAGPVNGSAGSATGLNAAGVTGIKGLTLNPSVNATQGSVITSRGNDVRLDSGTQLVLRVVANQ